MDKKTGFTLIELLVTISILGILSAIAIVAYRGVTTKARDSQRIMDLQTIKQALELYRSDVRNYPTITDLNLNTMTELKNGTGAIYLSPIPTDKDSSRNYYYLALPNTPCDNTTLAKACLSFILCAKKESTDISYDLNECKTLPSGSCGGNCDIGISSR